MEDLYTMVTVTTTTPNGHTRTRLYDTNGQKVNKGDYVVVHTLAGELLMGRAAMDSREVNDHEVELLRAFLGIPDDAVILLIHSVIPGGPFTVKEDYLANILYDSTEKDTQV